MDQAVAGGNIGKDDPRVVDPQTIPPICDLQIVALPRRDALNIREFSGGEPVRREMVLQNLQENTAASGTDQLAQKVTGQIAEAAIDRCKEREPRS